MSAGATVAARRPSLLRVLPPGLLPRRPQRMIERHVIAYRRQWLLIVSGFFEPLFYLLSMRAGVGELVGTVTVAGKEVAYDAFVAPALMASSAMNGAIYDSTGNVFHRLRFARIYDAALATPMSSTDVAVGEIGWALIRGQIYAVGFLGVMAGLGMLHTWWALLALPASALIGLMFASVGFLGTSFMRSWADMEIVNTVTMPLFLFSATFFPLSAYGDWGWVVQISPLYHGVALVRAATTGTWSSAVVVHALVLAAIAIAALTAASRRIDALLRR